MSFNFIDNFLERLNLFSTLKNGLEYLNWDNSMTYRILDYAIQYGYIIEAAISYYPIRNGWKLCKYVIYAF